MSKRVGYISIYACVCPNLVMMLVYLSTEINVKENSLFKTILRSFAVYLIRDTIFICGICEPINIHDTFSRSICSVVTELT